MRVRNASPFLLFFAPSLVYSVSENIPSQRQLLHRRDAQDGLVEARRETQAAVDRTSTARPAQTTRPYRGTDDAPVDGLDGKPHAGPFVDTTRDEDDPEDPAAVPTSLAKFASSGGERWKLEDIPERNDGVMNDDSRVAPKKGTTGTEGGISEKERQRKEAGYVANLPQEPKTAPASPGTEQELVEADFDESSTGTTKEYTAGLERPEDLPDRPHDIPYPDRTGSSTARVSDEPPVDGSANGWLKSTMPYTEGKTNPKSPSPHKPLLSHIIRDDETWHEWFHSFVLSFTMIIVSEIGDKTFLVAALMAMRHSQIVVFTAAFSAMIVMTVLSVVLGHAVPTLISKRFTTFAAALLFLVFGAKLLREGLAMPKDMGVGEEMKEVEAELEEKEHSMALQDRARRRSSLSPYALESGQRGRQPNTIKVPNGTEPSPPASRSPSPSDNTNNNKKTSLSGLTNLCSLIFSPVWVQTFVMTFIGEWGDRSQIATIAMAAGQDYWQVTLGALTGHACTTGLAVVGGSALAGRVSMRMITMGGAIAFLAFGVIYLFECIAEG